MGMQFQAYNVHRFSTFIAAQPRLVTSFGSLNSLLFNGKKATFIGNGSSPGLHFAGGKMKRLRREFGVVASSSNVAAPFWDGWKPEKSSASPSLSDILWPSAGTFLI